VDDFRGRALMGSYFSLPHFPVGKAANRKMRERKIKASLMKGRNK
jgi:hypothetical protein